jgi:SAM-dependent methyltransferase
MSGQLIDVKELIGRFSLTDLNEAADEYWQLVGQYPQILAKPYNLGAAEHILPQLGFLIQGLQLYAGMTVLEFGAGSCYASRILNQLGLRVISTDVSAAALEIGQYMRERMPPVGDVPEHLFSRFDGERFDVPDVSVDRIFCLDAFHHVPNQAATLAEMGRILKEGGIAGFCEPGPHHSRTPEAQREMQTARVIENDIVLTEILEMSRACGFTEMKVAAATIHPPLIPLDSVEQYFANPAPFVQAVHARTTNFPIFFLYKGDPTIRDSRKGSGLSARITPDRSQLRLRRGERATLVLDVVNTSSKRWLASGQRSGCVNVGATLRERGDAITLAHSRDYRFSLSLVEVEPGAALAGIVVDLGVLDPGEYALDVDLVSEHVTWFQSVSDSKVTIEISVGA